MLRAGWTVRNYGFLVSPHGTSTSPVADPFSAAIVQVAPFNPIFAQAGITDPYFRGFDQTYPDLWRYNDWNPEFTQYKQQVIPTAGANAPTVGMRTGWTGGHARNKDSDTERRNRRV